MSDERKLINEEELELVSGGMMKFSGGSNTMTYTHKDGTVTKYKVNGDIVAAYKRSCVLHSEIINNEDKILEILKSENIIGKQL